MVRLKTGNRNFSDNYSNLLSLLTLLFVISFVPTFYCKAGWHSSSLVDRNTLARSFRNNNGPCRYNGSIYDSGESVQTGEPCLNCTCAKAHLICHLRVCPKVPVPPPPGCIILHRRNVCCPRLICSSAEMNGILPEDLEGRSRLHEDQLLDDDDDVDEKVADRQPDRHADDQPETRLNDNNFTNAIAKRGGCKINGTVYAEGSAMSSSSQCEYCYCLKGKQHCVKPNCILKLAGCTSVFLKNTCCPLRYNCTGLKHVNIVTTSPSSSIITLSTRLPVTSLFYTEETTSGYPTTSIILTTKNAEPSEFPNSDASAPSATEPAKAHQLTTVEYENFSQINEKASPGTLSIASTEQEILNQSMNTEMAEKNEDYATEHNIFSTNIDTTSDPRIITDFLPITATLNSTSIQEQQWTETIPNNEEATSNPATTTIEGIDHSVTKMNISRGDKFHGEGIESSTAPSHTGTDIAEHTDKKMETTTTSDDEDIVKTTTEEMRHEIHNNSIIDNGNEYHENQQGADFTTTTEQEEEGATSIRADTETDNKEVQREDDGKQSTETHPMESEANESQKPNIAAEIVDQHNQDVDSTTQEVPVTVADKTTQITTDNELLVVSTTPHQNDLIDDDIATEEATTQIDDTSEGVASSSNKPKADVSDSEKVDQYVANEYSTTILYNPTDEMTTRIIQTNDADELATTIDTDTTNVILDDVKNHIAPTTTSDNVQTTTDSHSKTIVYDSTTTVNDGIDNNRKLSTTDRVNEVYEKASHQILESTTEDGNDESATIKGNDRMTTIIVRNISDKDDNMLTTTETEERPAVTSALMNENKQVDGDQNIPLTTNEPERTAETTTFGGKVENERYEFMTILGKDATVMPPDDAENKTTYEEQQTTTTINNINSQQENEKLNTEFSSSTLTTSSSDTIDDDKMESNGQIMIAVMKDQPTIIVDATTMNIDQIHSNVSTEDEDIFLKNSAQTNSTNDVITEIITEISTNIVLTETKIDIIERAKLNNSDHFNYQNNATNYDESSANNNNFENNADENRMTNLPPPLVHERNKLYLTTMKSIEDILNITNKKQQIDYESDYDQPTLPPSLPNLKIIPFVAADAVVDEPKETPIEDRQDVVKPITLFEGLPIYEPPPMDNQFSPPVETEGGFIPRDPSLDGPYFETKFSEKPTTVLQNPVLEYGGVHHDLPSITVTTEFPKVTTTDSVASKHNNYSCVHESFVYKHGELISEPRACNMCVCLYGKVSCQEPKCPAVLEPGCYRVKNMNDSSESCCGKIICQSEVEQTEPAIIVTTVKYANEIIMQPESAKEDPGKHDIIYQSQEVSSQQFFNDAQTTIPTINNNNYHTIEKSEKIRILPSEVLEKFSSKRKQSTTEESVPTTTTLVNSISPNTNKNNLIERISILGADSPVAVVTVKNIDNSDKISNFWNYEYSNIRTIASGSSDEEVTDSTRLSTTSTTTTSSKPSYDSDYESSFSLENVLSYLFDEPPAAAPTTERNQKITEQPVLTPKKPQQQPILSSTKNKITNKNNPQSDESKIPSSLPNSSNIKTSAVDSNSEPSKSFLTLNDWMTMQKANLGAEILSENKPILIPKHPQPSKTNSPQRWYIPQKLSFSLTKHPVYNTLVSKIDNKNDTVVRGSNTENLSSENSETVGGSSNEIIRDFSPSPSSAQFVTRTPYSSNKNSIKIHHPQFTDVVTKPKFTITKFRPSSSTGKPMSDTIATTSSYGGLLKLSGCNIFGRMYRIGKIISELSSPCLQCMCTQTGVQCNPIKC